jgi:putative oxygen-independent coproporphyrinogen III oxidase
MSLLQLPPLSLYIHIPWCERKCPYCDFNSHAAGDKLPEADYVAALLRDLDCDLPLAAGRELESIFIGGGTPSLFSGQSIQHLLSGVRERIAFAPDIEITLEANPGSAEVEKFAAFVAAGVNRLSLGVQTFNDDLLKALGRVHDAAQAQAAIEMAASVGLASFNIDLMHGLPAQTWEIAKEDLKKAIASNASHVSWYQLTIEPNTEFYSRPPSLPVEDVLATIQDQGEVLLQAAAFNPYEVSAWVRGTARCRHNLNYWNFGDYLGIGAGAHGKLSSTGGEVLRLAKRRQPERYLAAATGDFCAQRQRLDDTDLLGEFMLNALRLHDGFELEVFEARTGLSPDAISAKVDSLVQRQLLESEAGRVKPSALGRRFLDSVVAEFFSAD